MSTVDGRYVLEDSPSGKNGLFVGYTSAVDASDENTMGEATKSLHRFNRQRESPGMIDVKSVRQHFAHLFERPSRGANIVEFLQSRFIPRTSLHLTLSSEIPSDVLMHQTGTYTANRSCEGDVLSGRPTLASNIVNRSISLIQNNQLQYSAGRDLKKSSTDNDNVLKISEKDADDAKRMQGAFLSSSLPNAAQPQLLEPFRISRKKQSDQIATIHNSQIMKVIPTVPVISSTTGANQFSRTVSSERPAKDGRNYDNNRFPQAKHIRSENLSQISDSTISIHTEKRSIPETTIYGTPNDDGDKKLYKSIHSLSMMAADQSQQTIPASLLKTKIDYTHKTEPLDGINVETVQNPKMSGDCNGSDTSIIFASGKSNFFPATIAGRQIQRNNNASLNERGVSHRDTQVPSFPWQSHILMKPLNSISTPQLLLGNKINQDQRNLQEQIKFPEFAAYKIHAATEIPQVRSTALQPEMVWRKNVHDTSAERSIFMESENGSNRPVSFNYDRASIGSKTVTRQAAEAPPGESKTLPQSNRSMEGLPQEKKSMFDLDSLAEQVISLIGRRLEIERERRGGYK